MNGDSSGWAVGAVAEAGCIGKSGPVSAKAMCEEEEDGYSCSGTGSDTVPGRWIGFCSKGLRETRVVWSVSTGTGSMSRTELLGVVVGTGRFVDRGGMDLFERGEEVVRRAFLAAGSSTGSGELWS